MPKPREITADAVLALLTETFPRCFSVYERRRKPLKVGIDRDILERLGGAIAPNELSSALRSYTSNRLYQLAMRDGAPRIDLDGNPAGSVTAEQAEAAWAWLRHYEQRAAQRKAEKAQAKAVEAEAMKPKRLSLADLKAAALARKAPIS